MQFTTEKFETVVCFFNLYWDFTDQKYYAKIFKQKKKWNVHVYAWDNTPINARRFPSYSAIKEIMADV